MVQETRPDHGRRAGRIRARLVLTLIGAAALVVGAFLNWTDSLAGNKLTLRSLVQNSFYTRSNMLHTVGALSVLIAIIAVLSLLDRTGWITRLAGLAGVVLFVLFAVQVYRHNGQHFNTAVSALRAGAWCQLGGGVVLLMGGLVRYRRKQGKVAPLATDDTIATSAPESASATAPTVALSPEEQREQLEPDTTVFRPPTPSEIGAGAKRAADQGPQEPTG